MDAKFPLEIQVSLDIGSAKHAVAIGLSNGEVIDEFEISHNSNGFKEFFNRIGTIETRFQRPVVVAMEGYNGYARPLDSLILARSYRLFNINSMKLARFREIFPGPAKTDQLDARLGLQLLQMKDFKAVDRGVIQEIGVIPEENRILKRLTRWRRRLIKDKTRAVTELHAELLAICTGLVEITSAIDNLWFLRFLTLVDDITQLAKVSKQSLKTIKYIGKKNIDLVLQWQSSAHFSEEAEWVTDLIIDEAKHILELHKKIEKLDEKIETYASSSEEATLIRTIPGFGPISSAELAGEIGTNDRFAKEASLSLYLGMSALDNSSGKHRSGKQPKHVNTRAKSAMMAAVDHHRKSVPESQIYYEKKRAEGKKHNQAIRSLGRHLVRVIYKMLKEKRAYRIPEENIVQLPASTSEMRLIA